MKKNFIFVILILIFIAGCSSLDSRGFYLSGEKKGLHKVTETKYNVEGYDKDGFDEKGFNREGYNSLGYNKTGYNKEGYNKEGYHLDGYDKEGYNREGYNREGYDEFGYDKNGYNKEGYNEEGYDKNGYNKKGYNLEGYNKEGYDKKGYNSLGYDKNGYNLLGWNAKGINEFTETYYDENGFDENGNSPYVFHSNKNKDLEVIHTFNILVTDNSGLPLKNINVKGNLKNEVLYYDEVYNKDFSIITDEQGKAKVIGTMNLKRDNFFDKYESYIKLTIDSVDYFSIGGKYLKIEGNYKKSDNKKQSKEVNIILTPKTTIIHQGNISVVDIEGLPLDKVAVTGKVSKKEIQTNTDKKGLLILQNSDFEKVEIGENNSTKFDLKYSKDAYYNNSDSFSIYEDWAGKTIVEDRKVTLYKPDDYFKKEFLNESKFKSLRSKIKLFLDGILLQSWIKDANVPYRSIGVYEFKGKKYIELNLTSTVVYNSLKANKYDIGKNLFGELVVKMLDSLVSVEDENISGVNLRVTGYTKSFAEEYALNTAIKYDFIMNKETIRKYKDKDITSQKLLDESVILMDNERIELRLQ